MRVALVPTGRTEWHGMSEALQRLFPDHEFYAVPTRAEVESHPDRFPYDGFTSNLLTEMSEARPPESARELVERAAQEALGDRRARAADLVLVVDDIEIANAHQPARVVRVMRKAVEQHLDQLQGSRARTAEALRERVSFHLIVPMIEAWFFGDRGALLAAGMPIAATPLLANADVEGFRCDDPAYRAATLAQCPRWQQRQDRKNRPKWSDPVTREHHPKGYLQWLCLDGAARNCTTYDETAGGAAALRRLAWATLLAQPGLRYARALLADAAEILGPPVTGPIVEDPGPVPATRRSAAREPRVLRNG